MTCGRTDAEPPWLDEAWRAQAGDERAARTDEERIRVEASWGRWLWLVAELTPTGAPQAHPCHVSGRELVCALMGRIAGHCVRSNDLHIRHGPFAAAGLPASARQRTALCVSWVFPPAQ